MAIGRDRTPGKAAYARDTMTKQPKATPAIVQTATMIQSYGDVYRQGLANWNAIIEVLVTDVVMPGMHGSELAQVIRKSRPDIGIVLISGDNQHALEAVAELGPVEFLSKPFTSGDLSSAVGRAVDAARRRADRPPGGGAEDP